MGSNDEEGAFCPNGISGCVATASAMLLSFYEKPSTLHLDFPKRPNDTVQLDWKALKRHLSSHSAPGIISYDPLDDLTVVYDCSESEQTHQNLGLLCRQIGYGCDATYKKGETSATPWSACMYMQNNYLAPLKYNGISASDSALLVNILKVKPVMVKGTMKGNPEYEDDPSHVWICDGYFNVNVYDAFYTRPAKTSTSVPGPWELKEKVFKEQKKLVHLNWGWHGEYNGYYNINVFNVSQAYKYDPNDPGYDENLDFSSNIYYYYFE